MVATVTLDAFIQAAKAELDRVSERRSELRGQIETLEAELSEVERRLVHLKALVSLPSEEANLNEPSGARTHVQSSARDAAEVAHEILRECRPAELHYRELAKLVQEKGGDLPGRYPAQRLVAHLVRDDRFVRPTRRGWYALREDFPRARNVGERQRHSRRRRAGSRRSEGA